MVGRNNTRRKAGNSHFKPKIKKIVHQLCPDYQHFYPRFEYRQAIKNFATLKKTAIFALRQVLFSF